MLNCVNKVTACLLIACCSTTVWGRDNKVLEINPNESLTAPALGQTTQATLEFWFKTADTSVALAVFEKASASHKLGIWLEGGFLKIGDDVTNQVFLSSPTAYADGQWHHLALVAQANENGTLGLNLLINGASVATADVAGGVNYAYFTNGQLKLTPSRAGLAAEYFDNITLTNNPAAAAVKNNYRFTTTESLLDFNAGPGGWPTIFHQNVPSYNSYENFSARYQGYLLAPVSGKYVISTITDDGVRLWLNNQQKINNWTYHGATRDQFEVDLVANTVYPLKIEFFQGCCGGQLKLQWRRPSTSTDEVIPAANLFKQFAPASAAVQFDEVRVWRSAREAQSIQASYQKRLMGTEEGLALFYPFDDAPLTNSDNQTVTINRSAQNANAVFVGNKDASFVVNNTLTQNWPDLHQNALAFNGTTQYVWDWTSGLYDNITKQRSFSVELWAQLDKKDQENPVFAVDDGPNTPAGYFYMGFGRDNKFICAIRRSGSAKTPTVSADDWSILTVDTAETDMAWHHWACTYDYNASAGNGVRTIYRDGERVKQDTGVPPSLAEHRVRVGSDYGTAHTLSGKVDELRVWQVARTPVQIKANFKKRLLSNQSQLALHQQFEVARADSSTYAFDDTNNTGRSLHFVGTYNASANKAAGVMLENLSASGDVTINEPYALQLTGNEAASLQLTDTQKVPLTDGFTVSFWVLLGAKSAQNQVVLSSDAWSVVRNANSDTLSFNTVGTTPTGVISNTPLTQGLWQNVMVTAKPKAVQLFIDGVLVAEQAITGNLVQAKSAIRLGNDASTTNNNAFIGAIDEIQLWRAPLSLEQVGLYHNAALSGMEANLAGYWPLNAYVVNQNLQSANQTSAVMPLTTQNVSLTSLIAGKTLSAVMADKAMYFDGVDDYADLGNLQLKTQEGLSIEFWARRETVGKAVTILNQTTPNGALKIGFTSANKFYCQINSVYLETVATYTDKTWGHWACVYTPAIGDTSARLSLYWQGNSVATLADVSLSYDQTAAVLLAKGSEGFYQGWLDEVRFWNRALGVGEVKALKNVSPAEESEMLVAAWSFDEIFGAIANDKSGTHQAMLYNADTSRVRDDGVELQGEDLLFASGAAGLIKSGLWQGTIELTQVNELHADSESILATTDTQSHFVLPILLHSDSSGQATLLSEVTVMQTKETVKVPKRVLITDQSLLSQYDGVVRRSGKLIGMRFSAPAFVLEYIGGLIEQQHPMIGMLAQGGFLQTVLEYVPEHPMNPYKHRYHPDLDKGKAISRNISLQFDTVSEQDRLKNPALGVSILTGTYIEKINGLHKHALITKGRFTVQQVSDVAELNR